MNHEPGAVVSDFARFALFAAWMLLALVRIYLAAAVDRFADRLCGGGQLVYENAAQVLSATLS